jgi:hypothetical protein
MPIYRKAPLQPPRLLLRIVVTAGAGALLGTADCGGRDSVVTTHGSLAMPSSGASSGSVSSGSSAGQAHVGMMSGASSGIQVTGSVRLPDDAGYQAFPGSVVMPPSDDAGYFCCPGSATMPPSDAGDEA